MNEQEALSNIAAEYLKLVKKNINEKTINYESIRNNKITQNNP